MDATTHMRRCLELAEIAARSGDTGVGALIVRDGEIVAEGVERTRASLDPSAHAEVEAIRQACRRLDTLDLLGCSLYSTVEPCVLCGYAIRRTGIDQVVYGVAAGQAGACTSSYGILADRDVEGWPRVPEVTGGVLADECLAALRRKPSRSDLWSDSSALRAKPMGQPTMYAWVDDTSSAIVEMPRPGGLYDPSRERVAYVNTHLQPLDHSGIDKSMQRYANWIQGEVRLIRATAVETIRIVRPNGPREYLHSREE